jgi:tetratricopeptide (TPR) repeat protein
MSPTEIAVHLDERFRLLTGKRRGRVERHQTLRATVEWSYRLLDDDERVVFERLGVFAGGFGTAAAGAVAAGQDLDRWQVMDAISSLVAKSMLISEDGADDASRYSMLETLRQFGRERLEETGNGDHWRRRHAEHYATWANQAALGLVGPDEAVWVARLRREIDNIRAVVSWAVDRDEPAERELAVRVVGPLGEAAEWHPDLGMGLLAVQAVAVADECAPSLRVPVLGAAAVFEMNQGRPERARALAEAALRDGVIATTLYPAAAFSHLGFIEMTTGDFNRALDLLNDARDALENIDNPYADVRLLGGLASFESMGGQIEQARRDAERALASARRSQNPSALAIAYFATAWALQRDDPTGALTAAQQCIELYRQGYPAGVGLGMFALAGGLRARLGDPVGALAFLHEAAEVARDQGTRPQLAAALDWALSPLVKLLRLEPAATFVGVLTAGALAEVDRFPGVDTARARILQRVSKELGDETTQAYVDHGTTMTYDAVVEHALHHLQPAVEGGSGG